MLYLSGIVITFFLVAVLAGKKDKSEADKILALWLFFIGTHLTFFYLYVSGLLIQHPKLLGLEKPFPLLHGPFLYLYISSLTNQTGNRKTRWLHLLPPVLSYIPILPFLFSADEHKIFTYTHQGAGYEWYTIPMSFLYTVSGIIYVVLSILKLNRHRKNIRNQFSNIDKINLAWLRYLIWGLTCIWMVVIFGTDEYIFATVVVYVFFIGYFGIKQTNIFSHGQPLPKEDVPVVPVKEDKTENSQFTEPAAESNAEKGKYLKSGLDENELHQIYDQLTNLMQHERLYTNPELTLGDTAHQLNIHPNYLSQVINSVSKKNFYDYINSQRVEEFNRVVKDAKNQKFTLLSLAFQCGFNSKTSFNRNFRKVTGLSPSQYLKQMNVSFDQVN